MFALFNVFGTSKSPVVDVHVPEDQRKAAPEDAVQTRVVTAFKQLQREPNLLDTHSNYVQALLDLLAVQLRRQESAVVKADKDSSASCAVLHTKTKLEQALTTAWQLVDHNNAPEDSGRTTCDGITFQALYSNPSILGAMQFCRFFTTSAGLSVVHKALGIDTQQAVTQCEPITQQQQPGKEPTKHPLLQKPFTLVVDTNGTGHVTSLQAALDMAAAAVTQGAEQHYPDHSVNTSQMVESKHQQDLQSADINPESAATSSNVSSTSALAAENLLLVLLPGTHEACCTLPYTVKHVTIAGIADTDTVVCEHGDEQARSTSSSSQQNLVQGMMKLHMQQPTSHTPLVRTLSGSVSTVATTPQNKHHRRAACLLTCPFGVESVKLQNIHFKYAGVLTGRQTAQFHSVLQCPDGTPVGKGKGSNNSSSDSNSIQDTSGDPYCIMLSAGCELRLEWCEFSGGAGGVLSEAGASVTARQCNFHQ